MASLRCRAMLQRAFPHIQTIRRLNHERTPPACGGLSRSRCHRRADRPAPGAGFGARLPAGRGGDRAAAGLDGIGPGRRAELRRIRRRDDALSRRARTAAAPALGHAAAPVRAGRAAGGDHRARGGGRLYRFRDRLAARPGARHDLRPVVNGDRAADFGREKLVADRGRPVGFLRPPVPGHRRHSDAGGAAPAGRRRAGWWRGGARRRPWRPGPSPPGRPGPRG